MVQAMSEHLPVSVQGCWCEIMSYFGNHSYFCLKEVCMTSFPYKEHSMQSSDRVWFIVEQPVDHHMNHDDRVLTICTIILIRAKLMEQMWQEFSENLYCG